MLINYGKEHPTLDNTDMQASGNLGIGLIKTINKHSYFYCDEKDCVYSVTIYINNVNFFNFFPTIYADDSVIEFKESLSLIEELEVGEHISYELQVSENIDGS